MLPNWYKDGREKGCPVQLLKAKNTNLNLKDQLCPQRQNCLLDKYFIANFEANFLREREREKEENPDYKFAPNDMTMCYRVYLRDEKYIIYSFLQ